MKLKINSKGQITIPIDLRNQFNFTYGVEVKMYANSNGELCLVKLEKV